MIICGISVTNRKVGLPVGAAVGLFVSGLCIRLPTGADVKGTGVGGNLCSRVIGDGWGGSEGDLLGGTVGLEYEV